MKKDNTPLRKIAITALVGALIYMAIVVLLMVILAVLVRLSCVESGCSEGWVYGFCLVPLAMIISVIPACELSYLIYWPRLKETERKKGRKRKIPLKVRAVTFAVMMVFLVVTIPFVYDLVVRLVFG